MEKMEAMFEQILDQDERITKVFKPHKGKMYLSYFLRGFFVWFWIGLAISISIGSAFGETTKLADGTEETIIDGLAFGLAALVTFVIYLVLLFVVTRLSYTKTYYAITNKKIMIRHGIIGVDYKSLDKTSVGAVTVNVSIVDKILHKNTGTIMFGSVSTPMMANSLIFRFAHITDPYGVYKEIKGNIDESRRDSSNPDLV